MAPTANTPARKSILISGDVMADHYIYEGDRVQPGLSGKIGTYILRAAGGARLLFDILDAVRNHKSDDKKKVSPPSFDIDLGIETNDLTKWPRSLHSFGVWAPFPHTSKPDEETNVWRLSSSLGYGEAITERRNAPPREKELKKRADIIVLDDGGLNFRHDSSKAVWPEMISEKAKTTPEWIVLKASSPITQGDLWRAVSNDRLADKLVVVTSIADVRREPVRISEGVSWERTALDLVDELNGNPSLEPLKRCKHCIISFGCGGLLHVDRSAPNPTFRLIYDPAHVEGDWEATLKGDAIGYVSCLVAGIVYGLVAPDRSDTKNPYSEADRFWIGINAGLEAERVLLEEGHGVVTEEKLPDLPWKSVAKTIVTIGEKSDPKKRDQETQRYYSASIPAPIEGDSSQRHRWTILAGVPTADHTDVRSVRPLVGIARRIALFGVRELNRIPALRTGKLLTVDRREIESIRIVERAIHAYKKHDPGKKPLSIALFGAPGSGKSFTVKQIAKSALGKDVPILEFNLSQFSGTTDLIGALHQVRDEALGPDTPVVFWDEFDSRNYEWLQYLLAPMQDGAFQEGQLTHPIGKCVFIFAGGTSCDFDHFGPSSNNSKKVDEFKSLKGPDFKSRVHNSITVLGPNKAPIYDKGSEKWEDDPTDICFPIRRALLVRSILEVGKNEELEIDEGMLTAILQIGKYTHGVRSLENLLLTIKRSGDGGPLRRSDLPNMEVLAMHVDCAKFIKLMNSNLGFKRLAHKLAPYIHGFYLDHIKATDGEAVYLEEFSQLPEEIKDDNRAAARRIPEVLEHAGLYVVPRPDSARGKKAKLEKHVEDIIADKIELLAETEHNGWMDSRLSNGWRYGTPRNNDDKIHDALIFYSELDRKTKDKDVNQVNTYKDILATVNYTISNVKPE